MKKKEQMNQGNLLKKRPGNTSGRNAKRYRKLNKDRSIPSFVGHSINSNLVVLLVLCDRRYRRGLTFPRSRRLELGLQAFLRLFGFRAQQAATAGTIECIIRTSTATISCKVKQRPTTEEVRIVSWQGRRPIPDSYRLPWCVAAPTDPERHSTERFNQS